MAEQKQPSSVDKVIDAVAGPAMEAANKVADKAQNKIVDAKEVVLPSDEVDHIRRGTKRAAGAVTQAVATPVAPILKPISAVIKGGKAAYKMGRTLNSAAKGDIDGVVEHGVEAGKETVGSVFEGLRAIPTYYMMETGGRFVLAGADLAAGAARSLILSRLPGREHEFNSGWHGGGGADYGSIPYGSRVDTYIGSDGNLVDYQVVSSRPLWTGSRRPGKDINGNDYPINIDQRF